MYKYYTAMGGIAMLGLAVHAYAGAPLDAAGEVGRTSYATLPFQSQIYQQSWASSPGFSVSNLFWQYNSYFTNSTAMAQARQSSAYLESRGLVPSSGSQLWEDVYANSFPAGTFKSAPSYINGAYASRPEHRAWLQWLQGHSDLFDVANDGGTMPQWDRSWGGSWGHISPLTPMNPSDCPSGMTSCTFADWYAYRWGQTAKLSGAYGIQLSDFSDSQPSMPSIYHDFNPRILAAFQAYLGTTLPAGTVSQQASYILAHYYTQWNDFLSRGYAKFFGALAQQIGANTGKAPLIEDQCSNWPGYSRQVGLDQRIIAQVMPAANYMCIWDDQTMAPGRGGQSMMYALGGMVIGAAREPLTRNGGNLEADDAAYWSAIAQFYPTLSSTDQKELGLKMLKRAWLETSWAHIADRSGNVRRALAFMSRDFWDQGKLDPTVTKLIQTIVPTRPFGFALYYSTAVERTQENAITHGGYPLGAYMNPAHLAALKDGGGVVNYYVSDAGLAAIKAGSAAAPAAWVVLDAGTSMPASELTALKAVAPVVTSLQQMLAFPNPPLSFSTSSLTGSGFYDQSNRLIVTASNLGNGTVNGNMVLNGLSNGKHTATDLFSGTSFTFTVSGGKATIPLSVSRWDSRVLAIV